MSIKPIETYYNGYRFRSRAEARWAVFFDTIGIPYQYELEGYDLGNGIYYLPDFYLQKANQFFEVKADVHDISLKDKEKIVRLANETGKYVIIGDSNFNLLGNEPWEKETTEDINERLTKRDWAISAHTYLVRCFNCGTFYFENELGYECTACGYYDGNSTFQYVSEDDFSSYKNEYITAINTAKQARFEHGETPMKGVTA